MSKPAAVCGPTWLKSGDVPWGGVVSRLGCHVVDVVSHRAMVSENCLGISRKDTTHDGS